MSKSAFIDTSALVVLYDKTDEHHFVPRAFQAGGFHGVRLNILVAVFDAFRPLQTVTPSLNGLHLQGERGK